jgi:5-methylcytosine-specific restriction protein A
MAKSIRARLASGEVVSIKKALEMRGAGKRRKSQADFFCEECDEPVRPHRAGGDLAEHFEHLAHNPQCSLSHEKKSQINMMTRKQFIESHGATCKNWNWSWSFINKSKQLVIFGAWVPNADSRGVLIFSENWQVNSRGHKSKGYSQSLEHIRLIEEEGYRLMTFAMQPFEASWKDGEIPKIETFTPELTEKTLTRIGKDWYAVDTTAAIPLAEELGTPEKFPEGARHIVTINAYERNPKARAACIAHHGHTCAVCGFDFARVYGVIGEGFIHVHHIVGIGKIGKEYKVDPITDLIPVCPNCHAIIHRTDPALTVEQLRKNLQK